MNYRLEWFKTLYDNLLIPERTCKHAALYQAFYLIYHLKIMKMMFSNTLTKYNYFWSLTSLLGTTKQGLKTLHLVKFLWLSFLYLLSPKSLNILFLLLVKAYDTVFSIYIFLNSIYVYIFTHIYRSEYTFVTYIF